MPASVRAHLEMDESEPVVRQGQNQIVGSNRVSFDAMVTATDGAVLIDSTLDGDVADAANKVLMEIRKVQGDCTLIFGGETTVNLQGDGLGGRNQELALRVAKQAQDLVGDWVFLSAGTDGRDGPTDAAGGLVDADTVKRMLASGRSVESVLADNDSFHGLEASGDLFVTGSTGTNVADVQVFLRRS